MNIIKTKKMQNRPSPVTDSISYVEGYRSPAGVTVACHDDWTRQHVMEGDGLCPLLYHHLHKTIKGREHALSSVFLPETIIFDHQFPRAWYFYDEENREIAKRPGKMLDAQTMYNYFAVPIAGCEVVAQFFYMTARIEEEWAEVLSVRQKKERAHAGELITFVEFLTAESLHHFLFSQRRKPDGVLQRFVLPKGEGPSRHNYQLHVQWAPKLSIVYRRTNRARLDDRAVPLAVRVSTFDGAAYLSETTLVADETKLQLQKICDDIAEHFYSTEKKRLTRLSLFFKADDNGRMWLLWCSGARVAADALNPSYLRVPLPFAMRTEVVNGGATTVERLRARRQQQLTLLALDAELFAIARDYEFALTVNASHKRQAKELGFRPPRHREAAIDVDEPLSDPQHPLHESYVCLRARTNDATSSRQAKSSTAEAAGPSQAKCADACYRDGLRDGSGERKAQFELAALAMDAWYSIYSATLSEGPLTMSTTSIVLAPPLRRVLRPDELAELTDILGLVPEETSADAAGLRYVVAASLLGAGRRLDRPSVQVESEVREFFTHLFNQRGPEIYQVCTEEFGEYFE